MRATTIRFSGDLWEMLEAEAKGQGVSTAQLIREAAILRVAALAARRGDDALQLSVGDLAERMRARRADPSEETGGIRDPERLDALRVTGLLDSGDSPGFDRLVEAAGRALNAPIALLSLIEADRQIYKSQRGLAEPWASLGESPLALSFCASATVCRETLVVDDARVDPEWQDHPAIKEMGVVAYLGAPLLTSAGHALGTLCVIDTVPRHWTSDDIALIEALGETAMSLIDATAPESAQVM